MLEDKWFVRFQDFQFRPPLPQWFLQWWTDYGPTEDILPSNLKDAFEKWIVFYVPPIELQRLPP